MTEHLHSHGLVILLNILGLAIFLFCSYVNYGRVEDIQKLEELGISLEGRIAISR